MKVYLAGKIPKGKELDGYLDWRQRYKDVLSEKFPKMEFLDPDDNAKVHKITEADSLFWFGRDSSMIKASDLIIVQGDIKLGAGTSQEILIAKYFHKPVIVILPKDTHHRRSNIMMRSGFVEDWIHPFIGSPVDLVVEKLEESLDWLSEYEKTRDKSKIKTIRVIDDAISYFEKMSGVVKKPCVEEKCVEEKLGI